MQIILFDVTETKLDNLKWLFVPCVVQTHPFAMFVGQSEGVTLTTPPCLHRHTSTMSGPTTESIWDLRLVYHKEKVSLNTNIIKIYH